MPVVLYERQRQILDFLAQFIQRNGYAPSLRDIADAMSLRSLATVHEHIKQLAKKGVVRVGGRGKGRILELVDKKLGDLDAGVRLPILGFFVEGGPIEPYSTPHAFLGVAPSMLSGKKRGFILQVKGNDLTEDGVFEGDFLVLEEGAKVKDKNVVVALLKDDSAVLKRFFKEATRIKLESIRAKKAPFYANKVKIQGKVKGVIRRY